MRGGYRRFDLSSMSYTNLRSSAIVPASRSTGKSLFAPPFPPRDTHRVIEITCSDSLLNRSDIIRVRVTLNNHFHPLTQPCELITDIPSTTETLELKELLVTKLLRVICLRPLFPNVEQGEMIPASSHKVLSCLIGMELLVLWPIEQRGRFL